MAACFSIFRESQIDDVDGNVLEIDDKGYSIKAFPKYLSNLGVYKSGYLALESGAALSLSRQGKVIRKQV